MSSINVRDTDELALLVKCLGAVETNILFSKLGMVPITRSRPIAVRQAIEKKKNGATYAYLIFSFSEEYLERVGIDGSLNFWSDENGECAISKGSSTKLIKVGNRWQFKIAKEKVCERAATEIVMFTPSGIELKRNEIKIRMPK